MIIGIAVLIILADYIIYTMSQNTSLANNATTTTKEAANSAKSATEATKDAVKMFTNTAIQQIRTPIAPPVRESTRAPTEMFRDFETFKKELNLTAEVEMTDWEIMPPIR